MLAIAGRPSGTTELLFDPGGRRTLAQAIEIGLVQSVRWRECDVNIVISLRGLPGILKKLMWLERERH